MKKINWLEKLSSRKFWMAVGGFVTAALLAFNVGNLAVEQVAAIIAALGVLVAYILGESYVDGKNIDAEMYKELVDINQQLITVIQNNENEQDN